ncbi:DUF3152 domain-containing protein [Gordonia sp. TBRC 11910]|uniref:DUF3152 domain-containing protein n=1 Tax=Gordonia asplenii TaxID=2725283 RepID=A0A848KYI7_9ACTN|nr:DUF3152 domain-containing protein [Gordonia asplenii]NMO01915.1 DUF3152 domain-containing protein [Gordonia asplenii]
MSRTDEGSTRPAQSSDAGQSTTPRRPRPDQPLRARWDPTDDSGRSRTDRDEPRKKQSALGRFVSTYGWRAYAIPVLVVLTIVLIVITIQDSHADNAAPDSTPDPAARNTDVTKESKAIGAPTGDIAAAALPAGALPGGGPFTKVGKKTYHVVPGTTAQVGTGGQVYTYTVEVENGLNGTDFGGDRSFGKFVDATLGNPRSWTGDGKVSFRRIDTGEPDLRISLSSTNTARELCGYQIKLETSCFYPPTKRVTLNEARWVRGASSYQGDDMGYRQYLVNHETGHGIGYEKHQPCKENGALAPIMMQQTFGTANRDIMALDPDMQANASYVCRPNPWPFPER